MFLQIAVILGSVILENFYSANWGFALCFHVIISAVGQIFSG